MGKQTKLSAELRDQILHEAIALFCEKGYDATNIQDIADRLGTTRTPVYYYYSNKQQLYMEAVKSYLSQKQTNYSLIACENRDFWDWVQAHLEIACRTLPESVFFNVLSRKEFEPLHELNTEVCDHIQEMKFKRVNKAIRQGELPADTDATLFVNELYVLAYGLIRICTEPMHAMTEEGSRALIALLLQQLRSTYQVPPADKQAD